MLDRNCRICTSKDIRSSTLFSPILVPCTLYHCCRGDYSESRWVKPDGYVPTWERAAKDIIKKDDEDDNIEFEPATSNTKETDTSQPEPKHKAIRTESLPEKPSLPLDVGDIPLPANIPLHVPVGIGIGSHFCQKLCGGHKYDYYDLCAFYLALCSSAVSSNMTNSVITYFDNIYNYPTHCNFRKIFQNILSHILAINVISQL